MICPKCGATLPDTAELCWSCRKSFVTNEESLAQGTIPIHKMSIKDEEDATDTTKEEDKQPAKTITPIMPLSDDNEDYVPSNYHKRKSLMVKASLLGLAGVVFLILSVVLFKPFVWSLDYYIHYGIVEDSVGTMMAVGVVFLYIVLLFYSIPGRKYVKGDAYGKLLFCIMGFSYFIYMVKILTPNIKQLIDSKATNAYGMYWWQLESTFSTFKLLNYAGYALTFISGMMLLAAAYTKDEKDMMKHNKKVK